MFEDLIRLWEVDFPGKDSTPIAIALRMQFLHLVDQQSLQDALEPFAIGFGEVDVLTRLAQQPPPHRLRPSDLADLCMVTTGAITGRIGRLEKGGHVVRVPSSSDKRILYVEMTANGAELLRRTRRHVAEKSRFLKGIRALSASERAQLNTTLTKLTRIFSM